MAAPGEDDWRSLSFRQTMVARINEAVQECEAPMNAGDLENQLFVKARHEAEYTGLVTRIIIHIREKGVRRHVVGPDAVGGESNQPPALGGQGNIGMMNPVNMAMGQPVLYRPRLDTDVHPAYAAARQSGRYDPFPWPDNGIPTPKPTKRIKIEEDNLGENLFKDEATKDFTIVGGGAKVKCHKTVLKARSNWFATMLQNTQMAEAQSGELKLEGMTEWGVNQLVRFLYGMEIPDNELTPDYAKELLQNGHAYELPELVWNIANFLLGKYNKWFEKEEDADALLELYFFTRVTESDELLQRLNNHLLTVMSVLPSKNISKSNRFHELSKEEAINLLCTLHDILINKN